MINFIIDKMCNCLLNKETKLEVPTIVMKVPNNKSLAKYNTKTGWYVNWSKFTSNVEVYKLLTKHDKELQGLIAIENDISAGATHIAWAVTAPHNNINKYKTQKYLGVGGHLFAIAIKKSIETGFGGIIYGEASSANVLNHYINNFNAVKFPFGYPTHPYRFILNAEDAKKIMEVYTYEWTD